jgi:hypothetical protein
MRGSVDVLKRRNAMKKAILALALVIATTSAALACGSYGWEPNRAEGSVSVFKGSRTFDVEISSNGTAKITVGYPKFSATGQILYLHTFEVKATDDVRALKTALSKRLRKHGGANAKVVLEERLDGAWRLVSWKLV